MKKMKWKHFAIAATAASILAGCSPYAPIETPKTSQAMEKQTEKASTPEIQAEETQPSEDSVSEASETSLADIKNLVGMKDKEAMEKQTEKASTPEIQAEETQPSEDSVSEASETSLADIKNLVGMKDKDTADLFGGGQENRNGDFYIGRIYQAILDGNEYSMFTSCGQDSTVESVSLWIVNGERDVTDEEVQYWEDQISEILDGNEYSMFTSCGQDSTVESVSLWIVNGERDVTDEEVQYWEDQISELMETEPSYDEKLSEGGSQNRKWISGGFIAGMNQMKDILTISFQPAVGELK